MRLVLCGGGTGGHIYPALSVLEALTQELGLDNDLDVLYLGQAGALEDELVSRAGIPFQTIPSGPVRGRRPWELPGSLMRISVGTWKARRALSRFRAQAVLATGGYASVPIAIGAWTKRVPLVVFLPDVLPGWAVRFMARLAQRVAVSAPVTPARVLDGKVRVTGYPVRRAFWLAEKVEGRKRIGLDLEEKVLLVSGASQGARSINEAVAGSLRGLLELCQVVHICGQRDYPWLREVRASLNGGLRERYFLFPYLHEELPWAMAAADLAVTRAGASVLGELPAVGLPAVLVPYPHAGGHQRHNARYLEEMGAAVVVEDGQLREVLLPLVGELLSDERRRQEMATAARRLARPDAACNIARLLLEVAEAP
ncbi:UDP-N-acetylglucosamine--N-acetylmuramyl-(pentapeptide) pyrophosphoryl-undecaprenol N-acetylglucosamine transferase [bacterium HR24]|jgi:UDP-N-acetylglucosamine--N-acetylmuramyl-(pentapeptide) pyrophosphoryl-undecaprenol N-acetylglucosamine transferase|nr:UDP-N-acetylglucosamine--N-acetylmuramyl-(pentapeptide) pyrophosphoryl-undecaprenol N-acetylglucosamine transferase [bacterium HR24]